MKRKSEVDHGLPEEIRRRPGDTECTDMTREDVCLMTMDREERKQWTA